MLRREDALCSSMLASFVVSVGSERPKVNTNEDNNKYVITASVGGAIALRGGGKEMILVRKFFRCWTPDSPQPYPFEPSYCNLSNNTIKIIMEIRTWVSLD